MSTIKSIPPDNVTVEQVFKALETETAALFEHLDFSFLVVGGAEIVSRPESADFEFSCSYKLEMASQCFRRIVTEN